MNVLSLFDGISCGQIALNRVGIKYDNYFASEIDKFAIKCTQHNYPNTIQLGNVSGWKSWDIDWSKIGLVTGGFPCQAWSLAGKQLGDKDERGKLFWVMLDIMKHVMAKNPEAKFLIENVKMKKEFEQYITFHAEQALGKLEKHLINSALVSAQNRNRYYWTNIKNVSQPEDNGLLFKDVIDKGNDDTYRLTKKMLEWINKSEKRVDKLKIYSSKTKDKMQMIEASHSKGISNQRCFLIHDPRKVIQVNPSKEAGGKQPFMQNRVYSKEGKSPCLTSSFASRINVLIDEDLSSYRYISPLECERLQTVPENYTAILSNTQRYKCLGNGWTVDVIAHIFQGLK